MPTNQELLRDPDAVVLTAASIETRVRSIDDTLTDSLRVSQEVQASVSALHTHASEMLGYQATATLPMVRVIARELKLIRYLLVLLCILVLVAILR